MTTYRNLKDSYEQLEERLKARSAELDALKLAYDEEIRERKRVEQELRLLVEITQRIATAPDFASALEIALSRISHSTGWAFSEVWVPSSDGTVLEHLRAWHEPSAGLEKLKQASQDLRLAAGVGLAGRVWQAKRPEWVRDLSVGTISPRGRLLESIGLRAAFGLPILNGDEVLCVLMFFMREARDEDSRMVELVSAIGRQLGAAIKEKQIEEALRCARRELEQRVQERTIELAIATEVSEKEVAERKRAQEEVQARGRQQATVTRIGQRALSSSDLYGLMNEVCMQVAETLGVEFCTILELLPDRDALFLRAAFGWDTGLVGQATVKAGLQSQAGFTLISAIPVIVEDLRTETRFSGAQLLHQHGIVSGLSVIIKGKERPWGVLGAHTTRYRSFSTDGVHFLQAVANVLSEATARKRSEDEKERSESWLRSLIATTQDAVVSIDRRGCIVLFNPAAERTFGYAAGEIVGRKVNALMAEPYASEHDDYIARYERTGEGRAIGRIRTVTAKRKGGELFPIELSVTKVAEDEDVIYAAFIRDISEKNRLQTQVVESERLAAIGTTAAKIGHELANPLNGLSLTIQLLEQRLLRQPSPPDDQVSATVKRLKDEISRLNRVVGEFRTIARRERFDFRSAKVADLVADVVRMQEPYFGRSGIQIEICVPPELPPIMVDEDKIRQVLLNLLKNAVEAMPGGGKITIEASATHDGVLLEITDTGIGIAADVDAFEPFVTTKKEGSGIGLVVVRQIITAHGGQVDYQSEPGKGTTFRVKLPRR